MASNVFSEWEIRDSSSSVLQSVVVFNISCELDMATCEISFARIFLLFSFGPQKRFLTLRPSTSLKVLYSFIISVYISLVLRNTIVKSLSSFVGIWTFHIDL